MPVADVDAMCTILEDMEADRDALHHQASLGQKLAQDEFTFDAYCNKLDAILQDWEDSQC